MKLWDYGTKMKKGLNISNIKSLFKNHYYVLILLVLTLFFFNKLLVPGKILNNMHHINDVAFDSITLKESLKYGQLHLWAPHYRAGNPSMALADHYLFDLNFLYLFISRNVYLSLNLTLFSYFFIGGLAMYILIYSLKKNQKVAFIAALIYMFNGYYYTFMSYSHLSILEGYALIPLIFLFTHNALIKKNWITFSILSGIFLGLQILSGSIILYLYTTFLIGLYLAFNLFRTNFKKVILKTIFVGFILVTISIAISSVKLLPALELSEMSNRSAGVAKEEFLGNPLSLSNIFNIIVTNIGYNSLSGAIGIIGFIFLLFSFRNYNKRIVIFFLFLAIISLLISTGGFLADLLFKLPGYGQLRHIERIIVLFVFSASVLVAYGYATFEATTKKFNIFKRYKTIIFILITLLILTELYILQEKKPPAWDVVKPTDIPLIERLSKDSDRFRTVNIAMDTLIGASGYNYNSQLGISTLKGGAGLWINDYIEYLAIAQQYNPIKLWSILNAKYIIAGSELDYPGSEFIGNYSTCDKCPVWEAYGPYLYQNTEVLPRAYIVPNAILVIGKPQTQKQFVYSVLLNPSFNPGSTVIVTTEDIDELPQHLIIGFNAIILLDGDINQNVNLLQEYVSNGGRLMPNIFNQELSISEQDIISLLDSMNGTYKDVKFELYSPSKVKIINDNNKGFLVISERFAYFPGWSAKDQDSNELILMKSNNVISSVIIDKDIETITFHYKPSSFTKGTTISGLTLVLIIIFFIFNFIKKRKWQQSQKSI